MYRFGRIRTNLSGGFTMIEIMLVVVILGILASLAVVMSAGGEGVETMLAARAVANDLQWAQSEAQRRQHTISVTFDTSEGSYTFADVTEPSDAVVHKITGTNEVVLSQMLNIDSVDMNSASFRGSPPIAFDALGNPTYVGGSGNNSRVILQGGDVTVTVTVAPVLGTVTTEKSTGG